MLFRWLVFAETLRGETELLQRFRIQLQRDRRRAGKKAHLLRPFEIAAVGHLEIARVLGNLAAPEAAVVDVALQLVGIRRALRLERAVFAAPARQQAHAWRAFVALDVVGVVAVPRRAVLVAQAG